MLRPPRKNTHRLRVHLTRDDKLGTRNFVSGWIPEPATLRRTRLAPATIVKLTSHKGVEHELDKTSCYIRPQRNSCVLGLHN